MARVLLIAALLGGSVGPGLAQGALPPVKIVVAAETSGPHAATGRQVAEGVRLALMQAGDTLAGRAAIVIPFDLSRPLDEMQAALPALVKQEQAGFVIGRLTQAGLGPQLKALSDAGVMTLIPGRGPADLAGKRCLANVFVTGSQEDQTIDTLAKFADEAGYRRLVMITSHRAAPQAAVLKKALKIDLLREVVLDDAAADFAREVAGVVSDRPGAVMLIVPQEIAVRVLAPLRTAEGMADVPVLTHGAAEESRAEILGPAGVGVLTAGNWAYTLDTAINPAFTEAFEHAFGHPPSSVAVHAYDAARLIASAVPSLGGKDSVAAVHERIRQAEIASPRGAFTFANNNFPVQDFYVKRLVQLPGGEMVSEPVKKVFVQFGDDYAAECPLK